MLTYLSQLNATTIGIVFGFMLLLVVLGMRVAFATAMAGFVGLFWIFANKLGVDKGFSMALKVSGTVPHSKISSLALSLIPPPIGLNCFVVAGVRKECSVQDVFRGVMPFFIADIITIGILINGSQHCSFTAKIGGFNQLNQLRRSL